MASNPFSLPASWRLDLPTLTRLTETDIFAENELKQDIPSGLREENLAHIEITGLQDAGLHRSIVKIESRFENRKTGHSIWKIGTGWLVRPDLLVTAGDVVYDIEYQLGTATQVRCYLGYRGRTSPENSKIQPRYGQKVVSAAEWIDGSEKRSRDIALIQVSEPFVINMCTCQPPASGDAEPEVTTKEPEGKAPVVPPEEEKVTLCAGCSKPCTGSEPVAPEQPDVEVETESEPEPEPAVLSPPDVPDSTGTDEEFVKVDEIELFYKVLSTVAKVDTESLPIDSPLLGSVGNLVSTAAGALLSYVVGADVIASGESLKIPGATERALLAEAALQAVLAIEASPELDEILESMKKNWDANAPGADEVAKLLLPYLKRSALEVSADHSTHALGPDSSSTTTTKSRRPLSIRSLPKSITNGEWKDFIKGLFGPTLAVIGREHVFSSIGPVLRSAVLAVETLVSETGKSAVEERVPKLLQKIAQEFTAGRSTGADEDAARVLVQRAIMADAALQALMSLSQQKLNALELNPHDVTKTAEGIFDFLKRVIQDIGPIVLMPAKHTTKKFAPILIEAPAQTTAPTEAVRTKNNTGKPSLRDMLRKPKASTKIY